MALSSTLVWEVRTTGNAANGGGFRAGATGTDYSQQDAAQVTYTDLTVNATTSTNVTSAANPFTAAHVGNLINISSGSPWTPGYYEVRSVSGNVATLDRSPAAVSSTGGAGKLGGAADHPATVAPSVVASNIVWVKAGTYGVSANFGFTASNSAPLPSLPYTRIEGYAATRGDGGRATLTGTGAGTVLYTNGNCYSIANFTIDGATTAAFGIQSGQFARVWNCKVSRVMDTGINGGAFTMVEACEVTGMTGNYGIAASTVFGCNVHDNSLAKAGIYAAWNGAVESCLVTNNVGATADGILTGGGYTLTMVFGCTVHGSGRHGINWTSAIDPIASNNVLSSNGGFGMVCNPSQGYRASPFFDGNAYYGNTSGTRSNGDDTTSNPQNASGVYANPLDRVLTASPFTNAAGGDFSLSNAAGGGALCRGTGRPTGWPGSSVTSSADMGAAQHQASQGIGGGGRIFGSGVIQPSRKLA